MSRHSNSIRRWNSKSTNPQTSVPLMPLVDRTNTQRTQKSTTTAATVTSSFLPELNSTPPMPTFQKPDMATSTPVRRLNQTDTGSEDPTPTRGYIPRKPISMRELPQISDPGDLLSPTTPISCRQATVSRTRPVATTALKDRVGDTPPLPSGWTQQHDRAICMLDARNYSLAGIVAKLRRTFYELDRGVLTPAMIDKRLRQLDQNVDIDYWRTAIEASEKSPGRVTDRKNAVQQEESYITLASAEIEDFTSAHGETSQASLRSRPWEGRESHSLSTLARTQSTSNLDDITLFETEGHFAPSRIVTSGFLTGFRSHIP